MTPRRPLREDDVYNYIVRFPVEWEGDFDFDDVRFPSVNFDFKKVKTFSYACYNVVGKMVLVDTIVYDGRMSFGEPQFVEVEKNGKLRVVKHFSSILHLLVKYKDFIVRGDYDKD